MCMKTALAVMFLAIGMAGCQSTAQQVPTPPNSSLTNAGFVAKRATTPDQRALLASLPPNQFVRQTANGKVTYVRADPAGCNCIHVGSQSAFQNFGGMQNTVYDMDRLEFGGGLDPDNIEDLSNWQPF
jgi:hypothetical protein